MKRSLPLLVFMLFVAVLSQGQELPAKILDQPDGITVGHFNSTVDTCLPRIFIGTDLQIVFPCYSKHDYQRVDISSHTEDINRLREILTREFMLNLNQCCSEQKCPDTVHGYFFMVKVGGEYNFQYLDTAFLSDDKCGTETLNEIIDLLERIK